MKRVLLAILCGAVLLTRIDGALADPASDQSMANRYQQLAQSGDDEAQFYLGALYSAGVGVRRSDEQAFRWFGRAANQGHSHAMLILAGLYAIGRGVERNNVEAYKWAYIVNAGSRVDEFRNGSRQLMGVLESRMSAEEINLAKTEASQWHAVLTARPAQASPPPASDLSRNMPFVAAPAPAPAVTTAAPAPAVTTATPAPAPPPAEATPSPQPSAKITDVDSILKEVPSGILKKFGF